MYNILGEIKEKDIYREEKRRLEREGKINEAKSLRLQLPLHNGTYLPNGTIVHVNIRDEFDIELYFIPRFLVDIGKYFIVPCAIVPSKNIKKPSVDRIIINRKNVSTYIKSFDENVLLDLIIEEWNKLGIIIQEDCAKAMRNILVSKFCHLSEKQMNAKLHKSIRKKGRYTKYSEIYDYRNRH